MCEVNVDVLFQIIVYNEGEVVKGCPFHVRVMPEVTAIKYTGMEPCAVGSIVEVLVSVCVCVRALSLIHI